MATRNMETQRDTHSVQCDAPTLPDSLAVRIVAGALRIEDLVAFMSVSKHFREIISESFGEKIERFRTYAMHSHSKNDALRMCATEGHFEELVWLVGKWSASSIEDIIRNDYVIFKAAARCGHLDILRCLVNRVAHIVHITPIAGRLIDLIERGEENQSIEPRDQDLEARKEEVVKYLKHLIHQDMTGYIRRTSATIGRYGYTS